MTDLRQNVVSEALTWIGTPYHHHARIKGVGVDCVHLLCAVFEACEVLAPFDPGNYPAQWHLHRGAELYADGLAKSGATEIDPADIQPGDIGLWRFGKTYSHGGIFVAPDLVVHSYLGRGVIQSRLTEDPLAGKRMRAWTIGALHGR